MERNELKSIAESVLFAVGEAVGIGFLADILGVSAEETVSVLDELAADCEAEGRGLKLQRMEDK